MFVRFCILSMFWWLVFSVSSYGVQKFDRKTGIVISATCKEGPSNIYLCFYQ